MKKTLITTATALAILATPLMNKANAASFDNNDLNNSKLAHYEYKAKNVQELQSWMNQVLSNYNIKMDIQNGTKQQAEKATQHAKPTTPVTQKPVQQAKPAAPTQTPAVQKPTTKPVQQPSTSSNQQTSYQQNAYEQQVFDLINKERVKNGLPAFKQDSQLSKMARTKSNDMATKQYFSHTSPTYGSPFDMMKQFGITYRAAGENIAMGQRSPREVVNAWMNSEGHRANILNKDFTHMGVGYAENGNYWTQEFIGK